MLMMASYWVVATETVESQTGLCPIGQTRPRPNNLRQRPRLGEKSGIEPSFTGEPSLGIFGKT